MSEDFPTILFVDDEPGILKAVRRLFIDEDWRIFLADSAEAGLEYLASESVDVVVSDVRMPGMDGIDFLFRVKEDYPGVSRIFLSGYAEKESIATALAEGCAQQIIPKPWIDEELKEILKNILVQRRRAPEKPEMLSRVMNTFASLPPLPTVYQELRTCLADREKFTIDQLVEIIRKDIAMSADLLHWANSALFGQRRKVDTVKRAIMLLGVEIVECLVLSESIQRILADLVGGGRTLDAERLQQHSMSCAVLARLLAASKERDAADFADRAFIAGLLHDIGLLVIASLLPDHFSEIDRLTRGRHLKLIDAEERTLQTTHAWLGAYLADRWSLPPTLVNAIRWHHEPLAAPQDKELVCLVALADLLASRFGFGICYEHQEPDFAHELYAQFNITSQSLDCLRQNLYSTLENRESLCS